MSATQYAYGTQTSVQIVAYWCDGCGIPYGLPEGFIEQRREDHQAWTCPNGCRRHFKPGMSDKQKLANEQARNTALQDQLSAAIREGESIRVTLLRDRARFANSVCPCCNRSFENVRRHMTTKHPEYDVTKVHQSGAVKFPCSCGRTFDTLSGLRIHQGWQRRTEGHWRWDKPDQNPLSAHLTEVES